MVINNEQNKYRKWEKENKIYLLQKNPKNNSEREKQTNKWLYELLLLQYWARNSTLYVSFTKAKDKNIDCGQLSWNMLQCEHQIVLTQD